MRFPTVCVWLPFVIHMNGYGNYAISKGFRMIRDGFYMIAVRFRVISYGFHMVPVLIHAILYGSLCEFVTFTYVST